MARTASRSPIAHRSWSPTGSRRRVQRACATNDDDPDHRITRSPDHPMTYEVTIAGQTHKVELSRNGGGWRCSLNGRAVPLDVISTQEGVLSLLIDGKSYEIKQETTASETHIVVGYQR